MPLEIALISAALAHKTALEALAPVEAELALLRRPTPALGRGFAGHGSARFLPPLLTRPRGRERERRGYPAVAAATSILRQEHGQGQGTPSPVPSHALRKRFEFCSQLV